MSATTIAFVIAGAMGLIGGLVVRIVDNKPLRQLRLAGQQFQSIIRQRIPTAEVSFRGGKHVHPVFWVKTARDVERDQLRTDATLTEEFRGALTQAGYSLADVPLAQLVFESQETVERDFAGSWSERKYDWHRRRYN